MVLWMMAARAADVEVEVEVSGAKAVQVLRDLEVGDTRTFPLGGWAVGLTWDGARTAWTFEDPRGRLVTAPTLDLAAGGDLARFEVDTPDGFVRLTARRVPALGAVRCEVLSAPSVDQLEGALAAALVDGGTVRVFGGTGRWTSDSGAGTGSVTWVCAW